MIGDRGDMDLECFVCDSKTEKYFKKRYFASPVNVDLSVQYRKCTNCGFTFSETHKMMPEAEWETLNYKFHHAIELNHSSWTINQPPYIDIATALHVLDVNDVISLEHSLDFAAGYGTLASILNKYFSQKISVYDEYILTEFGKKDKELLKSKYETVINTAMFEHVTDRKSLDQVAELVKNNGVLIVHTFISEVVPCEPDWFYLEPIVHCAFFTNKSMQVLMDQWGFVCSIYIPTARIWVLFKKREGIKSKIKKINEHLQKEYIIYAEGFCDYWK